MAIPSNSDGVSVRQTVERISPLEFRIDGIDDVLGFDVAIDVKEIGLAQVPAGGGGAGDCDEFLAAAVVSADVGERTLRGGSGSQSSRGITADVVQERLGNRHDIAQVDGVIKLV